MIIAASIVASLMIMFLAYLLPLEQNQRLLLGIFDLAVVIILAVDYYSRLSASPNKRNFLLRQWDELPAMIPIIVFAFIDTSSVLQFIRFLTIFRIVRLYRILYLLKGMGGELVAFAGISGMSIIFGAFAIFIAEEGMPDSAINNMYDALWWSVETITTVTYGGLRSCYSTWKNNSFIYDVCCNSIFMDVYTPSMEYDYYTSCEKAKNKKKEKVQW